jgi:predicted nucleic acid-binding protein
MKIVIDSNIIFSALISGKEIYVDIFRTNDIFIPDIVFSELNKYEARLIKKAVKALPLEGKIEVLTMLEDELFAMRFRNLLIEFRGSAQKYPMTLEEITKGVESIRQKRYESRN